MIVPKPKLELTFRVGGRQEYCVLRYAPNEWATAIAVLKGWVAKGRLNRQNATPACYEICMKARADGASLQQIKEAMQQPPLTV